jgi:hypothetical protein
MDKFMIKDFFARIKGPHFFLSLIFLGLGFMVLTLSVKAYIDYSRKEILFSDVFGSHDPELSAEDLMVMLDVSTETSVDSFEVVARKNLFSPDREAWEPPPPMDGQEQTAPVRSRRVSAGDFRLYGITFFKDEKMALIYFQRLPENSRNRLVLEGETVYHELDGGSEAYRVVSIGADSVTLEAAGDLFEVWLFSHERQGPELTESGNISVVLGGMDKPRADLQETISPEDPRAGRVQGLQPPAGSGPGTEPGESYPDGVSSGQPGTARQSGPGDGPAQFETEEQGPAGQDIASPSEDMDRQVEEGAMIRVDTPFGPVYRPVE